MNTPTPPVQALGAVETLPIDAITPAPDNPRKIPTRAVEIVAKSLAEFGWQQPIVTDTNHVIIVGHTRYQAARSLGLTTVPVTVAAHLTDDQIKAYRIADNRTGDYTTWDYPELVQQLEDLAGDYSDVLGLQDWQAIVNDFESATDGSLDVPDHIAPHLDPAGGFHVTVVFRDEETAVKHQQQIIEMEGVLVFVTSAEQRAGLMVAVITGGRPEVRQRPTAKLLKHLDGAGFGPIVWVVAEHHAAAYEDDGHELAVYPTDWAHEYAAEHWMSTKPLPEPGGFLGAFPGREWACREAERRGCWGVLQLDDNILDRLGMPRGGAGAFNVVRNNGGLALFADLIAAVTLSTNGRMVGANLDAVITAEGTIARPGFPYSCFIEQVGEGREEWFGPFEDDITHAFQYGTRADGATALLMPLLRYMKESKSKTGMRAAYNHERAVQLQRIFPESAKVSVRATHSNGKGGPRVFHTMQPGAIRNPLMIHDHELFGAVRTRMGDLLEEWHVEQEKGNRAKVQRRLAALAKKTGS